MPINYFCVVTLYFFTIFLFSTAAEHPASGTTPTARTSKSTTAIIFNFLTHKCLKQGKHKNQATAISSPAQTTNTSITSTTNHMTPSSCLHEISQEIYVRQQEAENILKEHLPESPDTPDATDTTAQSIIEALKLCGYIADTLSHATGKITQDEQFKKFFSLALAAAQKAYLETAAFSHLPKQEELVCLLLSQLVLRTVTIFTQLLEAAKQQGAAQNATLNAVFIQGLLEDAKTLASEQT